MRCNNRPASSPWASMYWRTSEVRFSMTGTDSSAKLEFIPLLRTNVKLMNLIQPVTDPLPPQHHRRRTVSPHAVSQWHLRAAPDFLPRSHPWHSVRREAAAPYKGECDRSILPSASLH